MEPIEKMGVLEASEHRQAGVSITQCEEDIE